jgi:hypothetical protein
VRWPALNARITELKEIQALLSVDEAMVLFSIADDEGYVFALTREGFDWKPLPAGAEVLSQKVADASEAAVKRAPLADYGIVY